jgi:nucleotide-binding universal stress UspA family protein
MVIRLQRKSVLDEKVPHEKLDWLKKACIEFRREDLYEPLRWILNLNINWLGRHLEYFVSRRRFVISANVMLYESKNDRARKYFQEALRSAKIGSARYQRLFMVLENLDVVSKIAKRFWELGGQLIAETSLFSRILVAVDGSKSAEKAMRVAAKLAKRSGARIDVVSVLLKPMRLYEFAPEIGRPPLGDYHTSYYFPLEDARRSVEQAVSVVKGQGVEVRGRVLKASSIVQSITEYTRTHGVDLIVLGTRGSGGFKRLLLGSVSNGVVSHARCPVMVVR